ncbi:hypothetical protein SAMN03097699_1183 [Flavobacteriaceae bacterium MAR_2010_188]|nr:hypothetical protein SAMN03097699_1183 [Flavobacteriaceae bacterium MAR_2010_188]
MGNDEEKKFKRCTVEIRSSTWKCRHALLETINLENILISPLKYTIYFIGFKRFITFSTFLSKSRKLNYKRLNNLSFNEKNARKMNIIG